MRNSANRKLLNLKLFRNLFCLYFHEKFHTAFRVIKNFKILRFGGGWDKLCANN